MQTDDDVKHTLIGYLNEVMALKVCQNRLSFTQMSRGER